MEVMVIFRPSRTQKKRDVPSCCLLGKDDDDDTSLISQEDSTQPQSCGPKTYLSHGKKGNGFHVIDPLETNELHLF